MLCSRRSSSKLGYDQRLEPPHQSKRRSLDHISKYGFVTILRLPVTTFYSRSKDHLFMVSSLLTIYCKIDTEMSIKLQ